MYADLSRRLAAPDWAQKRLACFDYFHWKCAVCDHDWRNRNGHLQAHHLHYRTLGRENPRSDLRPLCDHHHLRGLISREQLKLRRTTYKWEKALRALTRFIGWIFRKLLPRH